MSRTAWPRTAASEPKASSRRVTNSVTIAARFGSAAIFDARRSWASSSPRARPRSARSEAVRPSALRRRKASCVVAGAPVSAGKRHRPLPGRHRSARLFRRVRRGAGGVDRSREGVERFPPDSPGAWRRHLGANHFAPTAPTSPATSLPGTGLFGLRRPIARRTRNGPPRTMCQPECLQESGPGVEVPRHRDCIPRRHSPWEPRTSRMPAPTASRSSPVRPALAQSSAQLDDRPNGGVRRCASPWEPIRFTRVLLVVDFMFGAIERIGHPAGQRAARDRDTWTWSTDKKGEMHA